jgi:hypothetical protein
LRNRRCSGAAAAPKLYSSTVGACKYGRYTNFNVKKTIQSVSHYKMPPREEVDPKNILQHSRKRQAKVRDDNIESGVTAASKKTTVTAVRTLPKTEFTHLIPKQMRSRSVEIEEVEDIDAPRPRKIPRRTNVIELSDEEEEEDIIPPPAKHARPKVDTRSAQSSQPDEEETLEEAYSKHVSPE